MISGCSDRKSCIKYPELGDKVRGVGVLAGTQCPHLFPESVQSSGPVSLPRTYMDQPNSFQEYAATAFTMLWMFGLKDEVQKLLGGQANSLRNVLTMSVELQSEFDSFGFWLEEVEGKDGYAFTLFLRY